MSKLDAPSPLRPPGQSSPLRGCDCPGCSASGEFPAPKGRHQLRQYYWFCLDHVREYNRAWDFYAGMSVAEIEAEMRSDATWQRPSWPLGGWQAQEQRLRDRVNAGHGFPFGRGGGDDAKAPHAVPATPEQDALAVLNLERNASFAEIKARYRELAKRHHPDANGGDREAEEKLKSINQAYTLLKGCHGR